MKKIMNNIFSVCLMVFLFLPASSFAANLIAITIADTKDDSVGQLVGKDLERFSDELQKISKYTQLNLEQVVFQDDDVTPWNVLGVLQNIEISSDDVVVFFFSGHGFRTDDKNPNPWPNLYFSLYGKGVDYQEVIDILKEKQPRLLVTVLNACNSYVPDNAITIVHQTRSAVTFTSDLDIKGTMKYNFNKLFWKKKGSINITSSKPDQYSYGNTLYGGLYTYSFLDSLEKEVRRSGASWEHLLTTADQEVADLLYSPDDENKVVQEPYYELNFIN